MNKEDTSNASQANSSARISRRKLLKWTPPLVAAISLPAHASCTPPCTVPPTTVPPTTIPPCTAMLIVETSVYECVYKDALPELPLAGSATATILSDGEAITITSLSTTSDEVVLPGVPATVTATSGITLEWNGKTSAEEGATSCPPVAPITATCEYTCGEDPAVKTQTLTVFA